MYHVKCWLIVALSLAHSLSSTITSYQHQLTHYHYLYMFYPCPNASACLCYALAHSKASRYPQCASTLVSGRCVPSVTALHLTYKCGVLRDGLSACVIELSTGLSIIYLLSLLYLLHLLTN